MKTSWSVVHVDDEQEHLDSVKEWLERKFSSASDFEVSVTSFDDFEVAARHLDSAAVDVVILDVVGSGLAGLDEAGAETAGRLAFERIRATRFVPVCFFTGFEHELEDLVSGLPLVRVVSKGAGGLKALARVIDETFADGLPQLNRALEAHVREVQRRWMWDWVAPHWDDIKEASDARTRANLVARRLAREMSGTAVGRLAVALGDEPTLQDEHAMHPLGFYVMPPPADVRPSAGDIMLGTIGKRPGYWVVLTPSCDFARQDPTHVLLAPAERLDMQKEFRDFKSTTTLAARKKLERLMMNNGEGRQRDRFHHLPGAIELPSLLVDFQQTTAPSWASFETLECVAQLDSPYAESMVSQFARYIGRLGTPDLAVKPILDQWEAEYSKA